MAVPFEENQGQLAPEVVSVARTFAETLLVTKDENLVKTLAGKPELKRLAQQSKEAEATGNMPDDCNCNAPTPRGSRWAMVELLEGAGELAPIDSKRETR